MHHRIREELFGQRRFRQALFGLIAVSVGVGLLIVMVEQSTGPIHSVSDGLWWAVTTVTGVGYGDMYPVTNLGRLLGATLQVMGVLMTGILIGLITTALGRRQDELFWSREFDRFHDLHERLSAMETQLKYLVRLQAEQQDERDEQQQRSSRKDRA